MTHGQPGVPRMSPVPSPRLSPLPEMGMMSADGRECIKHSFPEGGSNNDNCHYHYHNRYQSGSSQEMRTIYCYLEQGKHTVKN